MKIRTRIILGFVFIVSIGFFNLTRWVINDVRPHYLKSMEESLIDTATLLASWISTKVENGEIPVEDIRQAYIDAENRILTAEIYDLLKEQINLEIYVTDKKGIVIFDSNHGKNEGKDFSEWNDVARTLRGEYGARATRTIADDQTSSVLYIAAPIKDGDNIIGCLTVSKPTASVNQFIFQARNKIIGASLIAGLAILLFGILLSIWVTRPVIRLTDYAHAIRDGRKVQLPALGKSEIGTMGMALEEMRDALEGKKYVEEYVQTLTHEIKNPLSGIRGASELLEEKMPPQRRKQFVENIVFESNRIQGIVDRMLQLAALESRKSLQEIESIDLMELIDHILQIMQPCLDQKRIKLTCQIHEPNVVQGERFLIRQSLINLIQNAMDFTPENGTIHISSGADDEYINIMIIDSGPGIPDYAMDKIFDRFYSLRRPDTQKKSTGLGLSFVKEVAILHGGDIQVSNEDEGGAIVVFSIPIHCAQYQG